jgi:hypothetical protein
LDSAVHLFSTPIDGSRFIFDSFVLPLSEDRPQDDAVPLKLMSFMNMFANPQQTMSQWCFCFI